MPTPRQIYFFSTCLVDLLYPQTGLAAMRLLRREGIEVLLPQGQTCCGQPAFNSGYRNDALAVARAQLDCFPREIPIVVPSGSCGGMIREHWPELFAGQPDESRACAIAQRTFEFTEFLVDTLGIRLRDRGEALKVAIHTSCSARRELGVANRIESLVGQLDNVEVTTQARKAECCGFGGTFAVKQADVSGAMVRDKTDALRATGAQRVISQDCGCLMNIGGAFAHQHATAPVGDPGAEPPATQHIAEFLWERT